MIITPSIGICGKPQPKVVWVLNGKEFDSKVDGSEWSFTYSANITTNLKPCEEQELRYIATGAGANLTGASKIRQVGCKFSQKIEFLYNF